MKHLAVTLSIVILIVCFSGCATYETADIVATTLPVHEFVSRLCSGTGLTSVLLITENISCLHDYTLQVQQMRLIQNAEVIAISGAGLESFLDDALHGADHVIDAASGLALLESEHHEHAHTHSSDDEHLHEKDPHIWLSIENAKHMAHNLCHGLADLYPEYRTIFEANLQSLVDELDAIQAYGEEVLQDLSCRKLVTFHDGFSYLAEGFGLTVLASVEEESGSEASAKQLIELAELIQTHSIPAIFTEINGSVSAADILSAETGVKKYALDMAISGNSYVEAMYHNINTLLEALQ